MGGRLYIMYYNLPASLYQYIVHIEFKMATKPIPSLITLSLYSIESLRYTQHPFDVGIRKDTKASC